jgi:uncharacterized protein
MRFAPRPRTSNLLAWPWLVLVAMLAAACACTRGGTSPQSSGQVRVEIGDVGFDQQSGAHFVLLEDKTGKRSLPILIGEEEARAIMLELRGVRTERPLTYQLLRNVIQQTGNHVDRVVISDVRDQIYYAKIYLDHGRYVIDSRPSDAIALAMGTKAPVFVAPEVFRASGSEESASAGGIGPAHTMSALDVTVQELTPELARYFQVAPDSGVLIADVGPSADKAGVQRGDVLTEIDGRAVSSAEDFARSAANLNRDSRVILTVRRGGSIRKIAVELTESAPGSEAR